MTADDFLNEFGHFADAPNGIKKLRELILQLAVRGKLVDQDPNDEPASELIKKIEAEKNRLVKDGKIKNPKSLPPVDPNDVPYELPQGWEWVRLGGVFSFEYGDNLPAAKRSNTGEHPVYGSNGVVGTHHSAFVKSACIVIGRKGSAGALNLSLADGCCVTDVAYYCCPPKGLDLAFSFMLFHTLGLDSLGKGIKPGLNRNEAYNLIVATPPLAEQKRIVAKVDQLMKLCDELEAKQQERTTARTSLNNSCLNALTAPEEDQDKAWSRISNNFDLLYDTPETVAELRKSILQLAVMGRLDTQNPNDEPASELLKKIEAEKQRLVKEGKIKKPKPLPPIDPDDMPYELPDGWAWVRLGNMIQIMDAGWSPKCHSGATTGISEWGVLKTTAVQDWRFMPSAHKRLPKHLSPRPEYEAQAGDILITRAGPINRVGVCCWVPECRPRLMISDKIIRFHMVSDSLSPRCISLSLNAGASRLFIEKQKSGMAESQMNISQAKLRMTPIPLFSLDEQHRIVAKVDTLMTLCDQLETKLKQSQSDSESLTASIVNHLTEVA